MSESSAIHVSLVEIDNLDELGAIWTDVQERSRHSFFTSWGWLRCWLDCLPTSVRPRILLAETHDGIVGLGLLNRHRLRRAKVVTSHGLFLNETGDELLDELTVEHNGLLADTGCAADVQRAGIEFLLEQVSDWDEIHWGGIDADDGLSQILDNSPLNIRRQVIKECACATVNLAALRESKTEYFAKLSSNTRQQVRRSMRLYDAEGKLELDSADSPADAVVFYDEMKRLHQAYWEEKGKRGAFGTEFCDRFHRRLIADRLPHGEIQLLRVRSGTTILGYLYNFVYQGRVYCYQSGFDYDEDPKRKPGLVSHALAVQHNLDQGAAVYDFLGGDSRYKQSLCTDSVPMRWLVWQRPRWRFRLEDALRGMQHRLGLKNWIA
jgi:hypothetical protein